MPNPEQSIVLSGFTQCHNALSLDYCIEACIRSLLPICDEVVVSDKASDDGTKEWLKAWARDEPKLRIIDMPWDPPNGVGPVWFVKWINDTRAHLRGKMMLHLDCDEVLDECAYPEIKVAVALHEARWFDRINYVKDALHKVPNGYVCGTEVARLGPSDWEMPSDEPRYQGEPPIRARAKKHPSLVIHHFGMLRRRAAFFAKSKIVQKIWNSGYDHRLHQAEVEDLPWYELFDEWKPVMSSHTLPRHGLPWLQQRGYLYF